MKPKLVYINTGGKETIGIESTLNREDLISTELVEEEDTEEVNESEEVNVDSPTEEVDEDETRIEALEKSAVVKKPRKGKKKIKGYSEIAEILVNGDLKHTRIFIESKQIFIYVNTLGCYVRCSY